MIGPFFDGRYKPKLRHTNAAFLDHEEPSERIDRIIFSIPAFQAYVKVIQAG